MLIKNHHEHTAQHYDAHVQMHLEELTGASQFSSLAAEAAREPVGSALSQRALWCHGVGGVGCGFECFGEDRFDARACQVVRRPGADADEGKLIHVPNPGANAP